MRDGFPAAENVTRGRRIGASPFGCSPAAEVLPFAEFMSARSWPA